MKYPLAAYEKDAMALLKDIVRQYKKFRDLECKFGIGKVVPKHAGVCIDEDEKELLQAADLLLHWELVDFAYYQDDTDPYLLVTLTDTKEKIL